MKKKKLTYSPNNDCIVWACIRSYMCHLQHRQLLCKGVVWIDTTLIDSSITVVNHIPTIFLENCTSNKYTISKISRIMAPHWLAGANLALPVETCSTVCMGPVWHRFRISGTVPVPEYPMTETLQVYPHPC
jgi:hypothetical protein